MARIRITIDYDVNLDHYRGARTKSEALLEDVQSVLDGEMNIEELVSFSNEDVVIEVIEQEVN